MQLYDNFYIRDETPMIKNHFQLSEKGFSFTFISYLEKDLILIPNAINITLDNQRYYLSSSNQPILTNKLKIKPTFYDLVHGYLEDSFNVFSTLEEQMIDLDRNVNQHVSFEKLSDFKYQAMKAERSFRSLEFIANETFKNKHLNLSESDITSLINHIHNLRIYATHLVDFSNHLIMIYNAHVSEKTSRTINRLTLFTIFATPITMISGIYGMNFIHMPGIYEKTGFYITLAIMILTPLTTYLILKFKKLL